MATNLILTKQSSENDIRRYFNAILELSKSDNEFPVNFNEVWMLVYQDKHKAVNELKDKFIEDIDYKALTQKVECKNGVGYSRKTDYYLTVPCLEFFIARKVRSVFEVYRQVFHRKMNPLENISRKDLARMLYESELENERLRAEMKRQRADLRKEMDSKIGQESIPGRLAIVEQLVFPGFANLQGNEQPNAKEKVLANRIHPSIAKTRYPGALLMYEVRSRLLHQRGVNVYMRDIIRFLHRIGWLLTNETVHNMPTAEAINHGWMLPIGSSGQERKGKSVFHPRMSEKGYEKFVELLMEKGGIR